MAIVSVSAFFNILLDQMIEKYSFDLEKEKLERSSEVFFGDSDAYNSMSLMQKAIELLKLFVAELNKEGVSASNLREFELQGRLSGFLAVADPEIDVLTEYPIDHNLGRLRPDILLQKADDQVVVELKRPSNNYQRRVREGLGQLKLYLTASKIDKGIIFAPSLGISAREEYQEYFIDVPIGELKVVALSPTIHNA